MNRIRIIRWGLFALLIVTIGAYPLFESLYQHACQGNPQPLLLSSPILLGCCPALLAQIQERHQPKGGYTPRDQQHNNHAAILHGQP